MMNSVEIIQQLLEKRGIKGKSEISEFLSDAPKRTHDPFLLHHMKEGVDLLLETVRKNGAICIYGDYDSDGITAVCILKTILSQLTGKEISYYIPSRFQEGYGLNKEAVKKIRDGGTSLMITVDCGSTSFEEVEYAKELGMDVIVTDHHDLGEKPPDCILINPKQRQCSYPFRELAGCGVAFKFAQGIVRAMGMGKDILNQCLDLVAIGTVGDIVPLVDENRTMVKYGLYFLHKRERMGLNLLTEKIIKSGQGATSEDIAYNIVPHINAAGRMERGDAAVELLLSTSESRGRELAQRLMKYNEERKKIQHETVAECLKLAEEQCGESLFPIVRVENAHEGIIGIAAGKMKDALECPAAVVTPSGDVLKGSARSTDRIDVFQLLSAHGDLMEKLGGHKGACGFSLKAEKLEELRRRVGEHMERIFAREPELFTPEDMFDMTLFEEDITLELAKAVETMEPFGNGNPKPLFQLREMHLSDQRRMGETGAHGRFTANFPSGSKVKCVLFGEMDRYEELVFSDGLLHLKGHLDVHRWQGKEELQITVKEIYAR